MRHDSRGALFSLAVLGGFLAVSWAMLLGQQRSDALARREKLRQQTAEVLEEIAALSAERLALCGQLRGLGSHSPVFRDTCDNGGVRR